MELGDALQANMAQTGVGNVAHEDPSYLEHTLPLVGRPYCATASIVDLHADKVSVSRGGVKAKQAHRCQHLGHATEMAAVGFTVVREDISVPMSLTNLALTLKNR